MRFCDACGKKRLGVEACVCGHADEDMESFTLWNTQKNMKKTDIRTLATDAVYPYAEDACSQCQRTFVVVHGHRVCSCIH